jgi:murein tripeptide amidase MpaA
MHLRTSKLVCTGLFLAFLSTALADPVDYHGHQLVRVHVRTSAELETLLTLSPDIWSDSIGIGVLDARIPPERIEDLRASGLRYRVLNEDLGPAAAAHLIPREARGTFDHFMPLDEQLTWMQDTVATYPDLCELVDVGDTIQGRDIWALHITGPTPGPKPAVLYHALQHAREWITGPVVIYLADHLLTNYGADLCITELVDRTEFYLIPCFNPDGYVHTWVADRMWRKNRRPNPDGSYGVDLNRNWGYMWGYDDDGSSPTPSSVTYRGAGPFSEPETASVSGFITAHPNILAYMDYHSYAEVVIWPYGYADVLPPEPDRTDYQQLGLEMQGLIASVHGLVYRIGPIFDVMYSVNGGSCDWVYGAAGRMAFSAELRDTGEYGFLLPPEQILPTCEENLPAILHLSEWASAPLRMTLPALPARISPDGTTSLALTIAAGRESYTPGSALLYYRFNPTSTFQPTPLDPLGGDAFEATFPPGPCGGTIEYYFVAQGDAGGTVRSPCGAPAATYAAEAVFSETPFADDFEADLGWTVYDSPGLTAGSWQRGIPVGGGDRGDPPTDADGSGRCYLTGNADGDSDIDGGSTILTSPLMDALHPEAVLSYYRWYDNMYGADPGNDIFYIEVSDDGGATWVSLENVGPSGPEVSGGWFHREYLVADIPGITNTDQFRIRFDAGDLGAGSVVEAGVDGVTISHNFCEHQLGDLNCDGLLNVFDIDPFVLALTSAPEFEAYYAALPDCDGTLADINCDGMVNAFDIDPFVLCLTGGGCPPCP